MAEIEATFILEAASVGLSSIKVDMMDEDPFIGIGIKDPESSSRGQGTAVLDIPGAIALYRALGERLAAIAARGNPL